MRSGPKTPKLGRRVKGRKRIGKFAGLMAADEMVVLAPVGLGFCSRYGATVKDWPEDRATTRSSFCTTWLSVKPATVG